MTKLTALILKYPRTAAISALILLYLCGSMWAQGWEPDSRIGDRPLTEAEIDSLLDWAATTPFEEVILRIGEETYLVISDPPTDKMSPKLSDVTHDIEVGYALAPAGNVKQVDTTSDTIWGIDAETYIRSLHPDRWYFTVDTVHWFKTEIYWDYSDPCDSGVLVFDTIHCPVRIDTTWYKLVEISR